MPTTSNRWSRTKELFDAAADLTKDERAAFLAHECGEDAALRREIESLLASNDHAESFIEAPPFAIPRDLFPADGETSFVPKVFGSYTSIRELGRGGLGTVYLAARSDDEYRKEVAIKVIRRGLDTDDILRRFRNERQILAQLDHPNIARLIDGGTTDEGLPYFVLEYVEGDPITDYCVSRQPSLETRLQLFRKVCAAVSYAHQNLVVHRDLKPSNILITKDGEPKLLDFGIAKLLGAGEEEAFRTLTEQRVMTPEYASPEQARGDHITTATDVYSLGVVLYELLTGAKPYRLTSRSPVELSRAITEQDAPRPSTVLSTERKSQFKNQKSLAGDLDNIVLMALRKEPARRYSSVGQFAEDLRRHLEGLPVIAHKDTWSYRTGKFIRRNAASVAIAALLVLTLIGAVVATARQAQVARTERDHARIAQTKAERLNAFLESLLASADPDGMGRDAKVVDVLDAAEKKIDAELGNQPEILGHAHLTMARAYAHLRQAPPAEAHARQALAITHQFYGDDHPATAEVMAFIGQALRVFRRFTEAEPLLRQALAVQRRFPPANNAELIGTMRNLADVLTETSRTKEAAPLLEESQRLAKVTFGETSIDFADGLNAQGNLLVAAGDPAGAELAFRHSIDVHRKLTPLRLSFFNPILNLSDLLFTQGKLEEMEALLREAQLRCRQSVGEGNPTYAYIVGRLGRLHFIRKDYAAAEPELQTSFDSLSHVYPKSDPNVVLAEVLLGLALTRDGKATEGEQYLREAMRVGQKEALQGFELVENYESALGECLLAQKKYGEAEPLLRTAYEDVRVRLGEKHPRTVEALKWLTVGASARDKR